MTDQCNKTTEALKMEVIVLMGRCVLELQRYELGMKQFLSVLKIEGDRETWKTKLQERKTQYNVKTLGQLIGHFTGQYISTESGKKSDLAIDDTPLQTPVLPQFEAKFSFGMEGEAYQALLGDLASLVDTRNELIHHFLQRFPLHDKDSCQQALAYLETVREMIKSHTKRLQGWDKTRVRSMSTLKDSLESQKFKAWFEAQFKDGFITGEKIDWSSARVIERLKRAESILVKDGWTDLNLAIAEIKSSDPDLTPKAHGCVSWRELLHTSGLFDIRRERGDDSTSHTYFRSRQSP